MGEGTPPCAELGCAPPVASGRTLGAPFDDFMMSVIAPGLWGILCREWQDMLKAFAGGQVVVAVMSTQVPFAASMGMGMLQLFCTMEL